MKKNINTLFVNIISTIIGAIFLISGISKFFVFRSFQTTISHSFPFVSVIIATQIAFLIISLEIIFGLFLILKYKIVLSSWILSILMTFFIGFLSVVKITGSNIICNCFGGLNIGFPVKFQILFDFLLLNGLIILNFLNLKTDKKLFKEKIKKWITPALFVIYVEFSLISSVWHMDKKNENKKMPQLISFLSQKNLKGIHDYQHKKAIFLMDFNDFNCSLCYDSFLEMVDSLRSKKNINSYYIFKEQSIETANLDSARMQIWGKINGINDGIVLANNNLFKINSGVKSSLIILDKKNNLLSYNEFPLSKEDFKKVLINLSN